MRKIYLIFFVFLFIIAACTDTQKASLSSYGSSGTLTLYSCDGKIIHQWVSSGRISTVEQSDGWEFRDSKTGKFIRVSGTVIIEN